jgi:hypothetical protein
MSVVVRLLPEKIARRRRGEILLAFGILPN